MPTYEYACRDCGEHLEVVQSFRDDALTQCPACHGRLRKVFSAAGIVFKGSGWHIKDYARSSGGEPKASQAEGDSKADSASKDGASKDGSSKEATASEGNKARTGKSSSGGEKQSA